MTSRIDYNNPKPGGAFELPYHYEMVSDDKRVGLFATSLKRVCKDRRVLDSGAGTGILSLLAAQAGASHVYTTEKDPKIFEFAKQDIAKSKFADKIKLINKDVMRTTLMDIDGQRVDVVIAENLSTWQITEPQIPILNYINLNLAKKTR